MERFALKIDLSDITELSVNHEKVMILVDPQWINVGAVEAKIKKLFDLQNNIGFKSSDGFFIPLEEPIEILKYVETLKAFNVETEQTESTTKRKSRAESNNEPEIKTTKQFIKEKKRKYGFLSEDNFTTSTPQSTHVAKRLKSAEGELLAVSEEQSATEDLQQKRRKKKAKKSSEDNSLLDISNQSENRNSPNVSKSKKKSKTFAETENQTEKSKNHIFFDNASSHNADQVDKENNDEEQKQKMEVIFLCELSDSELTGRGRSFQIGNVENNSTNNKEECGNKQKISIIENITLCKDFSANKQNDVNNENTIDSNGQDSHLDESSKLQDDCTESSLISCEESAVIDLNESEKSDAAKQSVSNLSASSPTCNQETEECVSTYKSNYTESNLSSFVNSTELSVSAIALTDLPNINDQLFFKLKLLAGRGNADFAGTCEYVNKRTKSIKIRLTDGHSHMLHLPQRFTGNVDDSNAASIINVKLTDMIEPKVQRA